MSIYITESIIKRTELFRRLRKEIRMQKIDIEEYTNRYGLRLLKKIQTEISDLDTLEEVYQYIDTLTEAAQCIDDEYQIESDELQ